MKNKLRNTVYALLCVGAALSLQSCEVVDADTGEHLGGFGAGGYAQSYGNQGGQMGPGGRRLDAGQQVIGQKRIAHTTTLRAFVKIGGDAPRDIIDRVEQATANEVGFCYAKSFESGGKPRWPSLNEVERIAASKFAANGHSLSVGHDGQPGCFKIMAYRPGVK